MTITDALSENGLLRRLCLTNTGGTPMPYTLAYHATFVEPAIFRVPLDWQFVRNEFAIHTGEMAELTADERLLCSGTSPRAKRIFGFYEAAGRTVQRSVTAMKWDPFGRFYQKFPTKA